MNLASFPRTSLGHFPTPLESMPNLGRHLGGPRLYVKRDDCTGLVTGGNKTRKLEFLVAEALAAGADTLVTQGATQSNHVRQTAGAARKLGMRCFALLERRVNNMGNAYEATGNVFLDDLLGCEYEFRPEGLDMNAEGEAFAESLKARGLKPYFIPGGGSNRTGALGYAECARELLEQAEAQGLRIDRIVHATGSTGTQAGLVAGLHALGSDIPVTGISVRAPRDKQIENVYQLARSTAELLGAPELPRSRIEVDDAWVGPGYGQPTDSMVEAIRMLADQEAILLDPVYSGKGMAGLIGQVRAGIIGPDENVVFLHTGGAAALFAYRHLFQGDGMSDAA